MWPRPSLKELTTQWIQNVWGLCSLQYLHLQNAWPRSSLITPGPSNLPLLPFPKGQFCPSWQSPLSLTWWANTLNSNMFSFCSTRDGAICFSSNSAHRKGWTTTALDQEFIHTRCQRPLQCVVLLWISDFCWSVWCLLDQLLPQFPTSVCATLSLIDWLNNSQLELKLSN